MLADLLEVEGFMDFQDDSPKSWKSQKYAGVDNGMVEGHVTKLKLIKRQGYGKADFPLLRKRVLHAL